MITVPLLDADNKPHKENMVVQIDLKALIAYLVKNGKTILSIKLRANDAGLIEPADPFVAKNPGSAFDHTVNTFCNNYNANMRAENKAAISAHWKSKLGTEDNNPRLN